MKENKLTTKDLMIGDWVIINNIPRQVTFIDDCINYKIMATGKHPDGGKISFVGELNEEVKPIPLTPEILEKNGFSEDYRYEDLSYAQSCGAIIGIHMNGKNGCMDEMYFKYVHELQHAFRLCGIEKEIEL